MQSNQSKSLIALNESIKVRAACEADVPFIFNSWLKSFKPHAKLVPPLIYFEFQHKLIEAILQRSVVEVACNVNDPNDIYAYLVSEIVDDVPVIHYAYTKHTYRGLGIQKHLGADKHGFYTHRTSFSGIAERAKMIYNPYLAYGIK